MTFDDVVVDIQKLVGKRLESIRAGAHITIASAADGRIEILNAKGERASRPLSELRKVWEALCTEPVVHVDSVLGGSGSSRNQPETILANLPYVEWLRYGGRKHLRLMGSQTHEIGTLRRMDAIAEHEVQVDLADGDPEQEALRTLVVSSDIGQTTRAFERVTGLGSASIEAGVYHNSVAQVLIVSDSVLPRAVRPGTYAVIGAGDRLPPGGTPVSVGGYLIHFVDGDSVKIAFVKRPS